MAVKKTKKTKAGRPQIYVADIHCPAAFYLVFTGHTEEEVAKKLKVSYRTLCYWKKLYPEFLQALKTEVHNLLGQVSSALLKKALGMTVVDVEEWTEDVVNPRTGEIVTLKKRKEITKTIPPDVGAINTVLANRDFGIWRRSDPPAPKNGDSDNQTSEQIAEAMIKASQEIMGCV